MHSALPSAIRAHSHGLTTLVLSKLCRFWASVSLKRSPVQHEDTPTLTQHPGSACACNNEAMYMSSQSHAGQMPRPCRLLLSPIVWPISKVLDCCLGRDIGTVYSQEELKHLMYGRAQTSGLGLACRPLQKLCSCLCCGSKPHMQAIKLCGAWLCCPFPSGVSIWLVHPGQSTPGGCHPHTACTGEQPALDLARHAAV